MGSNLIKLEEEFLEEISMTPSLQLKELVSQLINNGTIGLPCNASLHTEDGKNVSIYCISSGNNIIWRIFPN